jgi:hypothetical protein
MHIPSSPTVRAGLIAGALLYGNALMPNSHAYPFIWPVLGGATALVWVGRHSASRLSAGRMLGIGAKVGTLAAIVAIVAALPTYAFLTTAAGAPVVRALGGTGPLPISSVAIRTLALALLLAVPAAVFGSIVARPFARRANM